MSGNTEHRLLVLREIFDAQNFDGLPRLFLVATSCLSNPPRGGERTA